MKEDDETDLSLLFKKITPCLKTRLYCLKTGPGLKTGRPVLRRDLILRQVCSCAKTRLVLSQRVEAVLRQEAPVLGQGYVLGQGVVS